MVGDESVPSVGTPAFLPLPAALPALSWPSTTALVAAPPESLRPAKPGPSLKAPPSCAMPAPGLTTAPACLAAAPPAHARLVCFVCCMMSLLFCSLLAICSGRASCQLFARRQQVALIPYIPRTLACRKASQFRLRSDATRAVLELFLWCHPRKQNGHTRHLVATKVGAVVFATRRRKRRSMWVRNGADCSRLPHVPDPANTTSQPRRPVDVLSCRALSPTGG